MKARRQMKILEIIRERPVETQEELARELRKLGMPVTQATVSRDIKDLNLVKVPTGDGRQRYAPPQEQVMAGFADRLRRVLRDSVLSLEASENLIVVKCLSGTAPAVGEALDNLRWQEIAGTVAGDNTVLVVVRGRERSQSVLERMRQLIE
ncbi:MAG: arginine repressor [Bacillota bacterium]|nr:arginine repressor [Bacillota bacterium]MDI7248476.1 arginine repressor [Bacillota bacterium]